MAEAKPGRLLIVDDEVELKSALCETLSDQGYETVGVSNAEDALHALAKQDFDLLLSDLMMPGMDGVQLLGKALAVDPNLVGIIMTGQGSISSAVDAMKVGAFDYVLKPFNLQTMLPILARALEVRRLRTENVRLRRYVERLSFESPRYQMIGAGPAMQRVLRMIEKVAPTDATVLVRGESGTGKELVARALHRNSPRRGQPMVTVNCAALQESLLESELFGHEKGVHRGTVRQTRADRSCRGGNALHRRSRRNVAVAASEAAAVLEDGHYRRVGGTKEFHANVRVIAATNKPLEEEQQAGRFREDLFYRLNVVSIDLPALRERREDIPALIDHFLTTRQFGSKRWTLAPDAMQALQNYDWPGNIRELANVIERAQILAEENLITLDDLPEALHREPRGTADAGPLNLNELERRTTRMRWNRPAAIRPTPRNRWGSAAALCTD